MIIYFSEVEMKVGVGERCLAFHEKKSGLGHRPTEDLLKVSFTLSSLNSNWQMLRLDNPNLVLV